MGSRATSTRTRIETEWASAYVWAHMNRSRATSTRTRIETIHQRAEGAVAEIVQERHPREQGLKQLVHPSLGGNKTGSRATSTRTRIETHGGGVVSVYDGCGSRATSTRTRIETGQPRDVLGWEPVQERHPREQGLKP